MFVIFHICKNHAFADGNKRTALASTLIFLDVNGYSVDADNDELENLTLETAKGEISKQYVIRFFREHITRE